MSVYELKVNACDFFPTELGLLTVSQCCHAAYRFVYNSII